MGKATEVVVKSAEQGVAARAKHWIRPPFAINELEFLLACTRCVACVAACPVDGALSLEQEKPVIDQEICLGCALCREACIVEEKAIQITSV